MKIILRSALMACLSGLLLSGLLAQAPQTPTSIDIYTDLQKLAVVGSALYIAAHPDDENTRMIAYLSNYLNVETTYLSLTRGDGGQNLIGTEIREQLGVLRTQELLAARRIDGGHQRFTRANDFGYSKSPEETKEIWNKDAVLGDVVWAIRQIKPDIIINRFSHDSGRRTHGHHTSSAQLSVEAMSLCGSPAAYPEQLRHVDLWQPQRLFFNTSWWFYGSREKFAKADKSRMLPVDIGVFYPLLGKSNSEIASESRSQHRCQGFGSTSTRGSQLEYLQLIEGDMPEGEGDPLEGIDLTWARVDGGQAVAKMLDDIIKDFDFVQPANMIEELVALRSMIAELPSNPYQNKKLKVLDQIILDCAGVYAELRADEQYKTAGDELKMDLEVIARSVSGLQVKSVAIEGLSIDSTVGQELARNETKLLQFAANIPAGEKTRSPYWLVQEGTLGMYRVDDRHMIGKPENDNIYSAELIVALQGQDITIQVPLVYTETDPAVGQEYFPFDILPAVTANIEKEVYVFGNEGTRMIQVSLQAHRAGLEGTLTPRLAPGWTVSPAAADFSASLKGEEQMFQFEVTPPAGQSVAEMSLIINADGQDYEQSLTVIDYEHIPRQVILAKAATKLVKVDLRRAGQDIAYIMGAGDKVPENLEQIGYDIHLISEGDVTPTNLKNFDAVIVGIRALNTQKWLKYKMAALHEYVENGGNLIYQYNTSRRLVTDDFSPYAISLSRDRVTKEEAEIRVLAPDHPVLQWPNQITEADFDEWVQERGLYFPDEWGPEYTAILSSNDPGEDPKDGGLLVAQHGKGFIVYTGYSYFRQLPAGVPGAFRLFANMISLGKNKS